MNLYKTDSKTLSAKFHFKPVLQIVVFTGFLIALILGELHHEIWRDEARALSIVRSADSIFDLPTLLNNEGHPLLWYILLYIGFGLTHSQYILPVLSVSIAIGVAFLMVFKSPFPLLFSALLLFGYWGLYEYGINCRNYGIAVLLMFLFAHLKQLDNQLNWKSVLVLCLLMQSNFYASVFAFLLGVESLLTLKNKKETIFYSCSLLVFFALSIWSILPNSDSQVVFSHRINSETLSSVWDVGYGFNNLFHKWFDYKHGFVTWVLLLSMLIFIKTPKTLLFALTSLLFMNAFGTMIRDNFIHHQGMWFFYILTLIHLNFETIKVTLYSKKTDLRSSLIKIGAAAILFIVSNNLHKGYNMYCLDWNLPKTDAPNLAQFLKQHSDEKDIWMSEPDYILESVMYYNYHPYYLPREKQFNSYVHFTNTNDSLINLSQILDAAESFKQKSYLIFEHKIQAKDSFYKYSMKQFNLDEAGKKRIFEDYQLLDSFNTNYFTDEHYFVYIKKP